MRRHSAWLALVVAVGALVAVRGRLRSLLVRLFGTELGQVRHGAVVNRRP